MKFSKLACQNTMGILQATLLHLHLNSGEMQPHVIKIIPQACTQVALCSAHFAGPNEELLRLGGAGW